MIRKSLQLTLGMLLLGSAVIAGTDCLKNKEFRAACYTFAKAVEDLNRTFYDDAADKVRTLKREPAWLGEGVWVEGGGKGDVEYLPGLVLALATARCSDDSELRAKAKEELDRLGDPEPDPEKYKGACKGGLGAFISNNSRTSCNRNVCLALVEEILALCLPLSDPEVALAYLLGEESPRMSLQARGLVVDAWMHSRASE